jgi:hypothetical protein
MGEMRNGYTVLVGKTEGKRLIRRSTRRQEFRFKMNLEVVGYGNVYWIHLAQDRD